LAKAQDVWLELLLFSLGLAIYIWQLQWGYGLMLVLFLMALHSTVANYSGMDGPCYSQGLWD